MVSADALSARVVRREFADRGRGFADRDGAADWTDSSEMSGLFHDDAWTVEPSLEHFYKHKTTNTVLFRSVPALAEATTHETDWQSHGPVRPAPQP
jgi:hypothetical protein